MNLVEGFVEYRKNSKGALLDSAQLLTYIMMIKDKD